MFRNQFDAQYGAALTAVVTVVTKSGGNNLQRHRLLLRPRQGAERAERLRADDQAALQPDARRRLFGGPICARTGPTSSAPTSTSTIDTRRSSRCRPPTRSRRSRTATIRSGIDRAHGRRQGRPPVQRSRTRVRALCLRQPVRRRAAGRVELRPAPRSTTASRTASSSSTTGCCRRHGQHACACTVLNHNLGTVPTNYDLRHHPAVGTPSARTASAAVLPAPELSALRHLLHQHAAARHQVGGDFTFASSTLRGALLRARRVHVHDRRAVQRQRLARPGRSRFDAADAGRSTTTTSQPDRRLRPGRLARRRPVRLNLGLRYDLDTNLRHNDFYEDLLAEPALHRPRQLRQRPTAATTTTTCSRASAPPGTSRGNGTSGRARRLRPLRDAQPAVVRS